MHAVADDLGLRHLGFHSPAMEDLLHEAERERLLGFARDLFAAVDEWWE